MSLHYSDPERRDDPYSLPDVEVFYRTETAIKADALLNGTLDANNPWCDGDGEPLGEGWYFWFCFPGCLPDSDPRGPYQSETAALEAARADFE
jgi:hypothetical protein